MTNYFLLILDCHGSLDFDKSDTHLYLPIPNPISFVDSTFYKDPGLILTDVPMSNPFHDDINNLRHIFNKADTERIIEKYNTTEAPKKKNFYAFLLEDATVKEELQKNERMQNMSNAIYALLSLSAHSLVGPDLQFDFEEFENLIKYLPNAENEDQQYNLDQLKLLLKDVRALKRLLKGDPVFEDIHSEYEQLEEFIRLLIRKPDSTKYKFTSGLYDILDNLIESKRKISDNSDPHAIMHLSPHDIAVIEVDPTRLDRKPRFSKNADLDSQSTNRPMSKYTVRYSFPSPVLSYANADSLHIDELVPLEPEMEETHLDYDLIEKVKEVLKDENTRQKIITDHFSADLYPTKTKFLEYVFDKLYSLGESDEVNVDAVLLEFIELYHHILQFVNNELGSAPKAVKRTDYEELLMLLPEPKEDEITKYEALQSFMLNDDYIDYIVKDMNEEEYNTRGKILDYVLQKCAHSVKDDETREACVYYLSVKKNSNNIDNPPEKYLVYRKSKPEEIDKVFVQLDLNHINSSTVSNVMLPEKEGILQIPVVDPKLGVDSTDITHISRMIPDVDASMEIYYNITDLKWQIQRKDTERFIFDENFDWRRKHSKNEAMEEVLDRLIALAYSEDLYIEPHSMEFAEIYSLALKIANGKFSNLVFYKNFEELIHATLTLTDNKDFIKECEDLIGLIKKKDVMDKVLGPTFVPDMYKNDVTSLRALLHKIALSHIEETFNVTAAALDVTEFLQQLGIGYNIELITTIEEKELDISECLDASFDRKTLPKEVWPDFRRVLRFMVKKLNVQQHLPDFDFMKFTTKSELIHGMMIYMIDNKTVEPELIESMNNLLSYIRFDGPGADLIH